MKVLLSAYQCQPDTNAEALFGWYWAINLSHRHEVVVVTLPWVLSPGAPPPNPGPGPRFEFCTLPRWCEVFNKPDHRHNIYYALWQLAAFFHARRLLRSERFDLVHHVVYCSTWQPTFMPFLGLPFIFGPIGEHGRLPWAIARHYGWGVVVREYATRFLKTALKLYSPLSRAVYRRASHVLVANNDLLSSFPAWIRAKATMQPSCAGFPESGPAPAPDQQFRVLYVGRFVQMKAPDLALRAFLKFAHGKRAVSFAMVGGGPMHADLLRMRDGDLAGDSVEIAGWSTRESVRTRMESCDVFLFPTFEGAGMVVTEAMALAKPVVSVAFGGPATYLQPDAGICVPVATPDEIVDRLARALETLYGDESLRLKIGRSARSAYEVKYSWTAKLALIDQIYQSACDSHHTMSLSESGAAEPGSSGIGR